MNDKNPREISHRRYLTIALCATFLLVSVFAFALFRMNRQGELVAPAFTGILSFDEKMRFMRNRTNLQCDVLVIGSSMALNNFHSETFLKQLPPGSTLLNTGVWGMKIAHTRDFVGLLLKLYRPKTVIMVSGLMDFYPDGRKAELFDHQEVERFVRRGPYWWGVATHFDLLYYLDTSKDIKRFRNTRADYYSVMFDSGGGVPLQVSFPNIDASRWHEQITVSKISEAAYGELDKLVETIRTAGIGMVYVQPPLRKTSVPPESVPALERHWERLNTILTQHEAKLVNLQKELSLEDEFFADYSHLNEKGAVIFTERVASQVLPK